MDIEQVLNDVKNHLEHGAELAGSHLPVLLELGAAVIGSPAVKSIIAARHLSPGFLSAMAAVIDSTEASLAEAEAARQAAEQAAAQPPPAA